MTDLAFGNLLLLNTLGAPYGNGSKPRTPSEHPNPHYNRLKLGGAPIPKWNIGFEPWPYDHFAQRPCSFNQHMSQRLYLLCGVYSFYF